jgi:starch synthase
MIAMCYGCIPIVPDIGGLHDTVKNKKTGFVYGGNTRDEAKKNLLSVLEVALTCYEEQKEEWIKMQEFAMRQRFEWANSAEEYIRLYKMLIKFQAQNKI